MLFYIEIGKRPMQYFKVIGMMLIIGLTVISLSCTSPTGSSSSDTGGGGGSGTGWAVSVSPAQNSLPNSIPSGSFPVLSSTPVIIRVVDSSGTPPANGSTIYLTCSNGAFGFKMSEGKSDYTQPITSTSVILNQGQTFVTFTAGFIGPSTAVINATYQGIGGSAAIEIIANPNA